MNIDADVGLNDLCFGSAIFNYPLSGMLDPFPDLQLQRS
jgi:hypothetical protein